MNLPHTFATLIQAAAAVAAAVILAFSLKEATFPTQETAAAALAISITLIGWSAASAVRHLSPGKTKNPQTEQTPTMTNRTRTAVVHATQEQLDQITRNTGLPYELAEISDTGEVVFHEAGPSILEEIARHTNTNAPAWDTLTIEQQSAIIMTAASSPKWCQGDLDPYRIDRLFEEEPQIRPMFTGQ